MSYGIALKVVDESLYLTITYTSMVLLKGHLEPGERLPAAGGVKGNLTYQ